MKGTTTLFLVPLVMGMGIAVSGLTGVGHEGFSAWQWCLAISAVLLFGLALGTFLNFAVFGPVYWLLRRLHSKSSRREHE